MSYSDGDIGPMVFAFLSFVIDWTRVFTASVLIGGIAMPCTDVQWPGDT